jgi:hypothetical protein
MESWLLARRMPTSLTAAHRKPPAEQVIFVVGFDTGGAPLPAVDCCQAILISGESS